jgi:hypothetical protein
MKALTNAKHLLAYAIFCLFSCISYAQDHSYPGLDVVAGAARADATKEQLCDPTFRTSTIRPPATQTNKLKAALFAEMQGKGLIPPGVTIADYELDHLQALTNGGFSGLVFNAGKLDIQASIKAGNLRNQPRTTYFEKESVREGSPWFGLDQPYPSAESKDHVEVRAHKLMCDGELTLKQAQILSGEQWMVFFGCKFMGLNQVCKMAEDIKQQVK